MGHGTLGKIMGPLALAGGIGATAFGQPEIGLPLMASGFGATVGEATGGSRGAMMGGEIGGIAGMGAGAIPGVGTGTENMLGSLGAKIPGLGGMMAGQGNVGAALASNPALKGITPGMVMPESGASPAGANPLLQLAGPAMKAMGMNQSQPAPPPPQPAPHMQPPQPPAAAMQIPQPSPPPTPPGAQQSAMQREQLLRSLGLG